MPSFSLQVTGNKFQLIQLVVLNQIATPTKLASVKVPIPSLEEQQHIVNHLENFQRKIKRVRVFQTQTTPELDYFLPSFINEIFRGP